MLAYMITMWLSGFLFCVEARSTLQDPHYHEAHHTPLLDHEDEPQVPNPQTQARTHTNMCGNANCKRQQLLPEIAHLTVLCDPFLKTPKISVKRHC